MAREPRRHLALLLIARMLACRMDRCHEEESPDHPTDPLEACQALYAEPYEYSAEHQGAGDTVIKCLPLVLTRNAQRGEDDQEEEEVVERQALLHGVGGDVLIRGVRAEQA